MNNNTATLLRALWVVVRLYAVLVAAFVVGKLLFLAANWHAGTGLAGLLASIGHGFSMDLATAGYFVLLAVALVLLASLVRISSKALKVVFGVYLALVSLLIATAVCVDAVLYGFWEFKLDATVLNYLDSVGDALVSVPVWYVVFGLLGICVLAGGVFVAARWAVAPLWKQGVRPPSWGGRAVQCAVLLAVGGCVFILMRGGLGKSTMNVGRAYYSECQFLNHAAVNPLFSFGSSALKSADFGKMYRYADDGEAEAFHRRVAEARREAGAPLLREGRVNVALVIVEGFSAAFVGELGGEAAVAPCVSRLCREGVCFDSCYANSFRTDRGVASVLCGYPAFPDFSLMKIPQKTRFLPTIATALESHGYRTSFLYGGDINFTNMNSFLLAGGFADVMGSTHFPAATRNTHAWGAQDHIVLDTFARLVVRLAEGDGPFFTTCLTLSSHEPWQVPYDGVAGDMVANSMAYTDSCLGALFDTLRRSPAWDNLLLVMVADHGIIYPEGITEADPAKHHIPMIWTGGAIAQPRRVGTLCTQSDLAATLLCALGLDASAFPYSKDIMSTASPFVFHTFPGGMEWMDSTGVTIYDLGAGRVVTDLPEPSPQRLQNGLLYLQAAAQHFNGLNAVNKQNKQ